MLYRSNRDLGIRPVRRRWTDLALAVLAGAAAAGLLAFAVAAVLGR
jgi:hypothetical protein